MATTTNYSWSTPDDTSLVKDGAAAIRTLGSSIDTTTKALNPSTTLGDIEYRSSTANTNTRLGIGTTGQVLTVSGGVPTWAAAGGGSLTLISTTTLSGASVTLSSIPSTYTHLYAIAYGVTNAGGAGFFRIAPNGTTNITTLGGTYYNGAAYTDGSQNSYLQVGRGNATTGGNNVFSILIENYTSSSNYKPAKISGVMYDSGGANDAFNYVGGITDNTAITSLVISHSGGNFNAGTIKLYGVN